MKKLLIVSLAALSLTALASAQQAGTSTNQVPPALPPTMLTGSSTLDSQVKALRQEYDAKIKSLQQEYLTKLKALIGDRKDGRASSTQARRDDRQGRRDDRRASSTASTTGDMMRPPKGLEHTDGGDRGDRENRGGKVEGTSTEDNGVPNGNAWGFFRKFLGF